MKNIQLVLILAIIALTTLFSSPLSKLSTLSESVLLQTYIIFLLVAAITFLTSTSFWQSIASTVCLKLRVCCYFIFQPSISLRSTFSLFLLCSRLQLWNSCDLPVVSLICSSSRVSLLISDSFSCSLFTIALSSSLICLISLFLERILLKRSLSSFLSFSQYIFFVC